jgi:hypothetical protein
MIALLVGLAFAAAEAQTRYSYSSGQPLNPAFEGWWPNDDGSYELFFGYMNTNWLQEFDIPVGADNSIMPGGPDQGQPTHFFPRRNPFLFTIRVPKDFGNKELVWTLTANGRTEHAYATLKPDYQIDKQVISTEVGGDNGSLSDRLRTNIPPELKVDGAKTRTVKVGQPLALSVYANDPDNIPARRGAARGRGQAPTSGGETGGAAGRQSAPSAASGAGRGAAAADASQPAAGREPGGAAAGRGAQGAGAAARGAAPAAAAAAPRPQVAVTASSGPGLRFSWIVYRGKASSVAFDPVQMKTWEDTRPYANSPWSPPYIIPEPPADNKWNATATFSEPGTYVLRAVASDGSLFTYDNLTVNVMR